MNRSHFIEEKSEGEEKGSPITLPFYPFILFMTPFFLIRGNNAMQKIVMLAMFLAYLFAKLMHHNNTVKTRMGRISSKSIRIAA